MKLEFGARNDVSWKGSIFKSEKWDGCVCRRFALLNDDRPPVVQQLVTTIRHPRQLKLKPAQLFGHRSPTSCCASWWSDTIVTQPNIKRSVTHTTFCCFVGHQQKQRKLPNLMWHVRKMSTNQQNILIAYTLCPCPYPGAAPKNQLGNLFPLRPPYLKLSFNYICNTGFSEI